jgi:putative FmdB family regulatory protein
MPTYEYECKKCGYNFEVFQSMSDEPVKKCQKCGKEVRRLIFGGAGIIFKGSGFYVTDKDKGSKTRGTASAVSKDNVKPAETAPASGGSAASTKNDASGGSTSDVSAAGKDGAGTGSGESGSGENGARKNSAPSAGTKKYVTGGKSKTASRTA